MWKSRKTRIALKAMCSWLAIVAVSIQPIVASAVSCLCDEKSDSATFESCCDAEPVTQSCCSAVDSVNSSSSCCSSTQFKKSTCKCDSNAASCECGDCQCADSNGGSTAPPAIALPTSNESQTQTFVSCSFIESIHTQATNQLTNSRSSYLVQDSLTAQETCVLLSRFTC